MRARVNTKQTAKPYAVPAPTGGLNGRDNIADMNPQFAYQLDNWFPGTASLEARKGSEVWATGMAPVETVLTYKGGTSQKMLAFAGDKAYDVTLAGAVGAPLQSGRTSPRIVSTMYSNAGAQLLIGVSGFDVPFSYNGAAITGLAVTGVPSGGTTISNVHSFGGRLYYIVSGELAFYYLPPGNIQGAAAKFDLAQIAGTGGSVVAMASYSVEDSGTGPHEYAVFITSEGEYIVYEGYDPSNAATWSLAGRFYAAPPIGPKCWQKYGSELLILTTEGALPFSKIIADGGVDSESDALTSTLGKYLSDLNQYSGVHGWQVLHYPKGGWLQISAPASPSIAGKYYTYVMNTKTKAWARFLDWNGLSWTLFNRNLYYSTYDGRVIRADIGQLDIAAPIKCDAKQAYNLFDNGKGDGFKNKQFHFAKILVGSDGTPPLSARMSIDFNEKPPQYVGTPGAGDGAYWDVSFWDVSEWGADEKTQGFTIPLGEYGYAGSLWLRGYLEGTTLKWYSTQYMFTVAEGLLI